MFWRRLAQNRLIDVTIVLLATTVVTKLAWILPSRASQNDFAHYYASSRLLVEGAHPYGVPLDTTFERFGFVDLDENVPMATNPPLLLWLFAPLAALSPAAAFVAWVMVEVACLVAALILTRRLIGGQMSARGWRLFVAGVFASPAVYWHFYYSQVQLLLAVLVLLAFVWHLKQKHTAACLAIASAGLLKLFPFVLLPWFVWRGSNSLKELVQRSSITSAFLVGAAILSGPGLWIGFLEHARCVLAEWATCGLLNYTVPSLLLNSGRILMLVTSLPWLDDASWSIGSAAGLTLIAWAYGKCLGHGGDPRVEFSLLCLVMLAGGVTAWVHYQVLLIYPVAMAAVQVAARPTRWRIGLLALVLGMLLMHGNAASQWDLHPYLGIWLSYCPLYGILTLAVFYARQLKPADQSAVSKCGSCPISRWSFWRSFS